MTRPPKLYPSVRFCVACDETIPRHPLYTDKTYASRDVCSRLCMRTLKGTQAERGAMRWKRPENTIGP